MNRIKAAFPHRFGGQKELGAVEGRSTLCHWYKVMA